MRKHVKKSLISIFLSTAISCVLGACAMVSSFTVKADASPAYYTLDGFTIEETAAVRATEPNGIRFTTELSETTKKGIDSLGLSNVSYGTLLIPADFLGKDALTHDVAQVLDIKTKSWQDENQTKYTSVLVGKDNGDGTYNNLPDSYYNRPIAARSYVTGVKDGQKVTYYSENTAVRSIGYVAYMAQKGGHNTDLIQEIVDKTVIEFVFNSDAQISAHQSATVGTTVVDNTIPQSTARAAFVTIGGVPVPVDMEDITYTTSNSSVIRIDGETLTAVGAGEATITASVTFDGKPYTATKVMSTEGYQPKSEYKILISEEVAAAPLNSNTTYLPAINYEDAEDATKNRVAADMYTTYYNAYEKTAAYKLQSVLAEATGIEFPIVTTTGEEGVKYISVGHTDLVPAGFTTGLKDTEAKVQAVDGNVIICGGTQEGTLYGVQRWLYDVVGYEYYMQNTYVLNDKAEIAVSSEAKKYERDIAFNVTQTSKLDSQGALDELGMRSYTEKIIPLGVTSEEERNGYYYKGIAHNSIWVLDDDAYSTTLYNRNRDSQYQKWYATKSDTTYNNATTDSQKNRANVSYLTIDNPYNSAQTIKAELCYTAHGDDAVKAVMVANVAEAMFTQMQKFPLYDRIGFAQMDHSYWCECDACKAQGNASDNLLEFLLDVAASLKTKLSNAGDARAETFNICTLFYHKTNVAPSKTTTYSDKVSAYMNHIEVWFAETGADQIDAYELTSAEQSAISTANNGNDWSKQVFANLEGWATLCGGNGSDMLWWGYYANTTSSFIPFNTIDALRRNYKTAYEQGIDYMFNQMMEFQTNWSSLKYFLMSKLTVNAEPTDEEWNGWIDSYFAGAYGPGAAGMKAYYNAWYSLTNSDAVKNKFRRENTYKAYQEDSSVSCAAMGLDARKWNDIFTVSELNGWIASIDTAIAALDVTDPNYETYYRNIMLEKLVPMYLLMWIHDEYMPILTSPVHNYVISKVPYTYDEINDTTSFTIDPDTAGTFASTTFVTEYGYGSEFLTWVADWKMTYDGENSTRVLTPFLTAIQNNGQSGGETFTSEAVSDRVFAVLNEEVTLYSTYLTAGTYDVLVNGEKIGTATVSTAGEVETTISGATIGETCKVTFASATSIVTFENVMVVGGTVASNAGAVDGDNGYYIVDKTYYIEEDVADTWLTHDLFEKGTYTVTVDGNSTESTVYYPGSLKVTVGAMLNGEDRVVLVKDSNNNTYVFHVIAARYIRTAEELKTVGIGGRLNDDGSYTGVPGLTTDSNAYGQDVKGVYVLVNDIDCGGIVFSPGHNYGKSNFIGIFDGNGYTVSNFKVWDSGIFGGLKDATIKNVNFEKVTIDIKNLPAGYSFGWNYGAVLANAAENTVIENVNVQFDAVITSVGYKDGNLDGVKYEDDGTTIKSTTKYHTGLLIAQGTTNVVYRNVNLNIANCPADKANRMVVTSIFGSDLDLASTTFINVKIFTSQAVTGWMNSQYGGIIYGYSDSKETAILVAPNGVTLSENSFAITNDESTIQIGDTLTITTDKTLSYTYELKEEVAGVSLSGNVVTVANTVKAGTTFTVIVSEGDGWYDEITLTVVKASETFATVYTVETTVDTTIALPAGIEGTILSVTIGGDFVAYDKAEGIGSINGNVVTPDSMPVKREHLGKNVAFVIETSTAIYTGEINVYTQIINTKEEFNNFETVAANNSVAAGYVIEEQKYAYLSGYFVLGNDIAYNDVWYPALSYAGSNNAGGLKKGSIYSLCNQTNDNVKGWIAAYGEDRVISMNGWTDTETAGFHATLDGNGYSIIGMQTTGKFNGLSVLGGSNGVVKDISFTQVSVGDSSNILFSFSKATIENVYIQVASMASGNSGDGATTLIGYASNTGATVRNVIIDATNCDITGLTRAYFVSLGICNAEGVYVIGGGAGLAETTTDLATPAAFWDKAANDTAAMFNSYAALLADGTHSVIAKAFDDSFWKVDEVNNLVVPNNIHPSLVAEELTETITIEQVNGTFTIPDQVTETITSVKVGATTLTDINGKTVTFGANDFVLQSDLGEDVHVMISTESGKNYIGYANVYTMIIDNVAELNNWQNVAADNSVKADLVLEAQKKAVLSGYFALGADIDYNATWSPILSYGGIWNVLAETGGVGKTVVGVDGAIFEDWGSGNKAGFKGVFDGNGHYIAGMAISGEYSGFIVTMGGGTIKDVAFTNASVGAASGYVFNRGQGTLENVYVEVVSIASGTGAGAYTVVLGGYQNGSVRELRNIVVDMSKANLNGLTYATVANLSGLTAEGVYVIGADEDELMSTKQEFTVDASKEGQTTEEDAKKACVFLHYNASVDYAGSFETAAALMSADKHGAYVDENFDREFWTVTAERVIPNCLAGNYEAENRVTLDLGYEVSGTAVTQALETTLDLSEVSGMIEGQTVSIALSGNTIYEGTISGNSLTLATSLFTTSGSGDLIITHSGGRIILPVYIDDTIELNQANAGTPDNLKKILDSKIDGHFALTSNLDMGGKNLKSIENFEGILDGNGYGIINTYISYGGDTDGDTTYSPNFIYSSTGTMRNIYFQLSNYAWTTDADKNTKFIGNGSQGIICNNYGTIENVYVGITLKYPAVQSSTRGLLVKENRGTIRNVVVDVIAIDGVTLVENTIAAITYYQNGTVENAYVVTNSIPNLLSTKAQPNPCIEVETVYDLPLDTIRSWVDSWSNMKIVNGEIFFGDTNWGLYNSEHFVPYYSATKVALSEYAGDATVMGFAATDVVYEAVSTNAWSNRVTIGNSTHADYLVFDYAMTSPSGATVWLTRNHTIVGGESYSVSSSGTASMNESKTERTFHFVDQNGNRVSGEISANTKYTMYVHLGGEVDIDGIMFGTGANFYIANVRYASGPETLLTHNNDKKLDVYTGDAADIGFRNGDIVYQMVTQDLVEGSLWWHTGASQDVGGGNIVDCSANRHRQDQNTKPYIPAGDGKFVVKIDFALSKAITSGNVFYVWGTSDKGGGFGSVQVNTYSEGTAGNGFRAAILDKNGSYVSSLQANTAYTLVMYMPTATMFNIGNIAEEGMTTYFLASSVENLDATVLDLGARRIAPQYEGDVTELGFEEGTTVYQSVQDNRSSAWGTGTIANFGMGDQALYLTKAEDEDYASVQFSVSRAFTGTYAFFTWWYNAAGANQGGGGYLRADGAYYASGTTMTGANVVVFEVETGFAATSFVPGKAYELRWYGEGATKFQLACCEANGEAITIYWANPSSGNDVEATGAVVYDRDDKVLDYYYGDVKALGFEEGTAVYGRLQDNRTRAWESSTGAGDNVGDLGKTMEQQCIKITKTAEEDYASIQFSLSRDLTGSNAFFAWCYPTTSGGDNCTTVTVSKNGTGSGGDITVKVFDLEGNEVTNIEAGKAYEMRFYSETNIRFQIGCYEANGEYIVTYFANPSSGNDA